jgi:5-methylcytosine-specific restriction protein A
VPCPTHKRTDDRPYASARGYDGAWTKRVRAAIARQPWCTYCGSTDDLTGDHPIPLSMSGSVHQDPIVACRRCNSSRGGANR